jgi:hypothetical protein
MKKRLTYLNPWQVGKVLAALYALLSLVFVPFVLLGTLAASHVQPNQNALPASLSVLVVFIPIAYVIMGFVFGVIFAAIYNLVAKWTGGIEFIVTDVPA